MFFAAAAAAILALWFGIHPSFATSTQTSPQPTAATAPQVIVIQPTPPATSSSPSPKPPPTQAPPAATSSAAPPPPASTSKAAPPPPPASSKPAPPPPPKLITTSNILNYAANASVDLNEDHFDNGQQVDLWPSNHSLAQTWTVWEYPDGSLVIQSDDKPANAGTKVLQVDPAVGNPVGTDVNLWDTQDGTPGLQAHQKTASFQLWTLNGVPGNASYGVLKNKQTGTCLAGKGSQQWLTMAPCNTGDQNQWFWLTAV